ncbi:MAG: arsenic resistance N-acetyltransferase ArsN2 [Gemmatimonadales bacterium]
MNVALTSATPDDLPAILDLLARCKLPRDGLETHLDTTVVAKEGARVVGCSAVEIYGAAALLRSVAVETSLRGLGMGQQLTTAALDLARGRGVRTAYLLTETAGDFFPRFGFRKITRAEVEPAVQRSVEFTTACPASALVMVAKL